MEAANNKMNVIKHISLEINPTSVDYVDCVANLLSLQFNPDSFSKRRTI